MDERIKELLKELGTAINKSISTSEHVNERIQKLRDEGYNLHVVLDATIALNKADGDEGEVTPEDPKASQFRINVNDLALLRSLGIDPTRKVKTARRVEPLAHSSD